MRQVLNTFARGSMAMVLALAVSACGKGSAEDSKAMGSIQAALTVGASRHDVTGVYYMVVDANGSCTDTPIAETTSPLEEEDLPGGVLPPGSGPHAGADGLFVLPPGDYRVCAMPMSDAVPSQECAGAEDTVTVFSEATTEILLVSQCRAELNGGIDVIVALNDPPKIENLAITPSKFITQCETATITATAADPDGDAISFSWSVISGPPGGNPNLPNMGGVADFSTTTPGDYQLRVEVSDANAASSALTFPMHVSAVPACPAVCGDGVCDASESCQSCQSDCGPCGGTCDHDECTIGGPLDPSCGMCVAAICQVDPFCCNTAWDGICKSEVGSVCGQTCPGSCGDGVCDGSESCQSCASDCGACNPCGDGICDGSESCQSCASDCGACAACPGSDLGSAVPQTVTGSTVGLVDALQGSCAPTNAPEATYSFTAPADGTYQFDTFGSNFDTVLYLRDSTCGGGELVCNDDNGGLQSNVNVFLTTGQTIVIVVDGFGGSIGNYALNIL
jgi:hypothetical protein